MSAQRNSQSVGSRVGICFLLDLNAFPSLGSAGGRDI